MIPKRIYQTWKTEKLPNGINLVIKNMMELNPNYTHYLFDDEQMDKYVYKNFDKNIYEAYSNLNIGAAKADLWRYLILYKSGGIYLDIDAAITMSLDGLIREDDSAIITREQYEGLFNQWILIFEKGHPLLKDVIQQCIDNINTQSSNNILHLTGSTVFTKIINQKLKHKKIQNDIWHTPDKILEKAFNKKNNPYKCRFMSIDMYPYAVYHSPYYHELYIDTPQWEIEQKQKSIFKNSNKTEQKEKKEINIVNL